MRAFLSTELRINDTVLIRNCPPISARKRFTLETVLKSPETEHDELLAGLAEGKSAGMGVLEALRQPSSVEATV